MRVGPGRDKGESAVDISPRAGDEEEGEGAATCTSELRARTRAPS